MHPFSWKCAAFLRGAHVKDLAAYPAVLDPSAVGNYEALAAAGGGFVWDEVLEYRVWRHPERGAPDEADGSDLNGVAK